MRKQTKLAAVASAAALLAIGASMTAFAASGWVEEDGVWYYYDSDGNRVEDEWKKSGDNWYWLDSESDGAMATDRLVDDDDNTYYVDSNGVMVTNTWVMVVNEDQDDDDDPAEYNYYYMQSNGKAYKQSGDSVQKKTINGKTYAFNEDGKMLYGWVSTDGSELNGEDDWQTTDDVYYFGSWEDGSMKTGWQKIYVHDNDKDDYYDYWFNFKSNGKRRTHGDGTDTWKSNGKYYHFNEYGAMVYEWFEATADSVASVNTWRYFNSPEDGARVTKGWFKVVPPTEDNTFAENSDTFAYKDSQDESERWYYADSDGVLAQGEIKKIKGKYYGFWPDDGDKGGRMLTGLCALVMNQDDGSVIDSVLYDDMDSDDLDDFMDEVDAIYKNSAESGVYLYYFGADSDSDSDGAVKTGNVTVTLDGDSYSFYFKKSGGAESRGRSVSGLDDGDYIYKFGQKMKAGSDEKYIVVYADGDTGDDTAQVIDFDSSDIRKNNLKDSGFDFDSDYAWYEADSENIKVIYGFDENMYLVNTSGKTQTSKKSGLKDGDDWYWYVAKGGQIVMYTNNKDITKISAFKDWASEDFDIKNALAESRKP